MRIYDAFIKIMILQLSLIWAGPSFTQNDRLDSLKLSIYSAKDDTIKVANFLSLSQEISDIDIKKAVLYIDEAIRVATKISFTKGLADAHKAKGIALAVLGNFPDAIHSFHQSLEEYQSINNKNGIANILSNLGSIYYQMGNDNKALEFHFQSLQISEEINNQKRIGTSYNNIGTIYQRNEASIEKALEYFKKALDVFNKINYEEGVATAAMNIGEIHFTKGAYDSAIHYHKLALRLVNGTVEATFPLTQMGKINGELGNFKAALRYHREAVDIASRLEAKFDLTQSLIGYAITQRKQKDYQGAIPTFKRSLVIAQEIDAKNEIKEACEGLSGIYALLGDFKSAYEFELQVKIIKDSIAKSSSEKKIQQVQFDFEISKKETEIELLHKDKELKNAAVKNQRVITFASLGGLLILIFVSFSLFRNNLNKQKANRLLRIQKEEINSQREKVEKTLIELQSTQAQLIQSEKLASLGELTAGIAHEIQNPLNFVNNFSELNGELIKELEEEASSEKRDTKNEAELITAIKDNSEKINQHGQRASSIVKGMLEHSRKSSGVKEPTDINKLCEEYVRLSYHGLRARDKDFNCDYKLDLDPNLPLVNVVSQDIGRVILNIVNNAFQACSEKSGSLKLESQEVYKPLVTLTTHFVASLSPHEANSSGQVCELTITDNGPGIPDSIKDKIFQPFFTTKPTGQGTGLGLSLAYDIVTKGHGGSIEVKSNYSPPGGALEVESVEGAGSEFTITLPFKTFS